MTTNLSKLSALTPDNAIPRRTSIVCNGNPEWGSWGIAEGMTPSTPWLVIRNARGDRVLHCGEFGFWSVLT
jgi:hypothetical protein